jgi:hypothetical protein
MTVVGVANASTARTLPVIGLQFVVVTLLADMPIRAPADGPTIT